MSAPGLARRLNLFDATMIVIAGIIGAGIFVNPSVVAGRVGTSFLMLAAWGAGGLIALGGAFVFAELSTVMPRAGGQYAFFRAAFHPLVGFLHGWSVLFMIQSAATAYVAVACAENLVKLGAPSALVTPIAFTLMAGVTLFHALGIKPGAILNNVVTAGKTLAIAALCVGAFAASSQSHIHLHPILPDGHGGAGLVSTFVFALMPVMFAYGGWQNVNYVAEEVMDPLRNLPRALLVGVLCVIVVYVGMNVAVLRVLGPEALAHTRTPAADMAQALWGPRAGSLITVLVVVSTFGYLNLSVMSAPRVYFAMARDGVFFQALAHVSPRFHAPTAAIVTQGGLAAAETLLGIYGPLGDFSVFGDWVFFSLAGVSLLVFRRTMPDAPRPAPTPFYPWLPAAFALVGAGIVANTFVASTRNALAGVGVIAAGVPVYFLWRRLARPSPPAEAPGP